MPFKVIKNRAMPVGIDLGTAVVKMAQMRSANGRLELLAAAQANVPDDCRNDTGNRLNFLSGCLRNLLKTHGFKGRRCVLSLPASDVFIQHIKTEEMPSDKLDKALKWELQEKLPFDHNDAIIRNVVVGQVSDDKQSRLEVIVLAISRHTAEAYLDAFRSSRLEVIALNTEPCAILGCFKRLLQHGEGDGEGKGQVTLFLDLGEAYTQVIISNGTRLVFARNLKFGAGQIDQAVAEALEIPVDQAKTLRREVLESITEPVPQADRLYGAANKALESLIEEISKCLHYYESIFPLAPVEHAIFLGGQARDVRLCRTIAQQLNLPSRIGDPLKDIDRLDRKGTGAGLDLHGPQPAWAVAVGLSLLTSQREAA